MTHDVSLRVTWTTCPVCGGPLAIGWGERGEQAGEVPVEFDCAHHCELTVSQAVQAATGAPVPGGRFLGPINRRD